MRGARGVGYVARLAAALLLGACVGAPDPVADSPYPDRPDPADAAHARDTLAQDVAESRLAEVGPRAAAGAEGERKAVEWAVLKLTVLGFENVRAEAVTGRGARPGSANVIGEIRGQTPEIVLLGTGDDAAGAGIVIAAAHRLASVGPPRRTIRVVLFAGAEAGGRAYAEAHADELARHALVMEAGPGSGAPHRLGARVADADWPEVARLAAELGLEARRNGQDGGVHLLPLRRLGVPEIVVGRDSRQAGDALAPEGEGLARAAEAFAAVARAASERDAPWRRVAAAPARH